MHLMPSHTLLTSSIQYGSVARSLPLTGRILPGYLDPSGRGVWLGIGNPNAEFVPDISTCAISSDGGTAKIVWGTRAGDVFFMTAPKVMDNSRRDTAARRCDIVDKHESSVLDVQWATSASSAWAVVTASADGRVKLWDAKTVVCQWTSQKKFNTVVPDPCLKVTAHGGCIAAVMKSGEIHIWTGFSLGSIATYEESSILETIVQCPMSISTPGYDPQATHAVIGLHIDPNPISASSTFLVAYENDPFFYRIQAGTRPEKDPDIDITTFGDPAFGSTSVVAPYFRGTTEQQASFVLVGDHLGWVSLYAWDSDNPSPVSNTGTNPITALIQPVRKFEAHHDSTSITALTWSPHTLIIGSARGTTHVFDALSFRHLRSFASPIPKTRGRHQVGDAAAEKDRQKVKQIIVGTGAGGAALNLSSMEDRDLVFISVGERVMAWKAGPVPKYVLGGVRARHTHGALGKKKKVGYAKYLRMSLSFPLAHADATYLFWNRTTRSEPNDSGITTRPSSTLVGRIEIQEVQFF
jgi:WD40 repeat protein